MTLSRCPGGHGTHDSAASAELSHLSACTPPSGRLSTGNGRSDGLAVVPVLRQDSVSFAGENGSWAFCRGAYGEGSLRLLLVCGHFHHGPLLILSNPLLRLRGR